MTPGFLLYVAVGILATWLCARTQTDLLVCCLALAAAYPFMRRQYADLATELVKKFRRGGRP